MIHASGAHSSWMFSGISKGMAPTIVLGNDPGIVADVVTEAACEGDLRGRGRRALQPGLHGRGSGGGRGRGRRALVDGRGGVVRAPRACGDLRPTARRPVA